jgi:hypothetical protein
MRPVIMPYLNLRSIEPKPRAEYGGQKLRMNLTILDITCSLPVLAPTTRVQRALHFAYHHGRD